MLIAGNWKMNTDLGEAARLAESVAREVGEARVDVAVCPPFVSLDAVFGALRGTSVRVGAQDVSAENDGAFTGEVSARMLRSVGCHYAIVGHSERRARHGETDALLARKLAKAQAHELVPILCVGETLDERRGGRETSVVRGQLEGALNDFGREEARRLVVAYEPVWAIGTGETATPEQAQAMHREIRSWLEGRFGDGIARDIPLLYGGSMKADNAAELLRQPDVDGGLVGGASLKASDFAAIVRAAEEAR